MTSDMQGLTAEERTELFRRESIGELVRIRKATESTRTYAGFLLALVIFLVVLNTIAAMVVNY